MTVAIVGGLDRLSQQYERLAATHDELEIRVFNRFKPGLAERIAEADGVILFTGLVSHQAAREVYRMARTKGGAVVCSHSAGISAAKRCLEALCSGDIESGCSGCERPKEWSGR